MNTAQSRLLKTDSVRRTLDIGLPGDCAGFCGHNQFAQFGPAGTLLPGVLTGTTTGGDTVTLISPGTSFQTYVEAPHVTAGDGTWEGTFLSGAPLLFDGNNSGAVALGFAAPITSLTLAAQANDSGNFVETIEAFSGSTLIDTAVSATLFNCASLSCQGTQAFLTVTGANITSVLVSVTNDADGFALYGGAGATATPLPAALPLFASGLAAAGLIGWRRKRKPAAAPLAA